MPDALPYGVDDRGRVVVAWGDAVVDLATLGGLDVGADVWTSGSLNAFFAEGPEAWALTRAQLQARLTPGSQVRTRPAGEVTLVLPFQVADYADFYASEAHATRMGQLLRPGSDPLPAAWRYLPMGYHGRSATVVVSGSAVPRPCGLRRAADGSLGYGPTARLDVEVEMGFVVGNGSTRGQPIPVEQAAAHVFGVVLVNDWSARDIQAFEYQPLGPFLGKSFATSVSPWVVPLDALAPYRVDGPAHDPEPAPYLRQREPRGYDVSLSLCINDTVVSRTSSADLYWSMAQQLAHLTANGANVRSGDLFASGTISGSTRSSAGSLMELAANGSEPIVLADGSTRTWLEDGDRVVIEGWCANMALGAVSGTVTAASHMGEP
jgi:fumarylacetoacetase